MEKTRTGSLAVIFLTVFIDLLGFGMVLPLLSIYAKQFTPTPSNMTLGLLMASFSAMQFLFAPAWGRLSDRIGRRPVLMVGLAGSVVFYTLFGIATIWRSLALLFVARIGAGIAGATISTAQAYIADTTTLQERAKGMALIGAAFGLGFAFGPLFGGLTLIAAGNEPAPWPGFAAAALSAVALGMACYRLPESLRPGCASAAKRLLDFGALSNALTTPSVGPLLIALFICILAFANFETTLSMLIGGQVEGSAHHFSLWQVCLTFAYIGAVLTFAQGFLVRRLSGRVPEGWMAATGALLDLVGFLLMTQAATQKNVYLLLTALTVVVMGFAFMMPSLNSLISRRSDPNKQGGILGVGQSISAMARIVGPVMAFKLLDINVTLPYWTAVGLMVLGIFLVIVAVRGGRDYAEVPTA